MTTDSKHEITVSHKPLGKIGETPQTPKSSMFAPTEEIERLFDRLMPTTWMRPIGWNWPLWGALEGSLENIRVPQLDIIDRDKEIVIRVEMPGIEKKNIEVSINNSTLSIRGSLTREAREQKKDYVRCEIANGNFSRNLAIPEGVDSSAISASLRDGILEVSLPKEASVQRRSVEVK